MPEDGLTPRRVDEPVAPVNAAPDREGERTRRPPVRSLLKDPVVPILLLAGLFDWLSGNPIHSLLLFVVAFGLGWEAVRGRPGGPEPVQRHIEARSTMAPLAWLGAIAYAAVAGGFGRYSWPATVAVIVPAAAMLAIAWREPLVARHELGPLDRVGPWPGPRRS